LAVLHLCTQFLHTLLQLRVLGQSENFEIGMEEAFLLSVGEGG
jgi:hypothetical protein